MNYPFLGFNTPGLQLGQDDWMSANTPAYQSINTVAQPSMGQIAPWQNDLSSAIQANTYNSLGLDAIGNYQPTGQTGNWFGNAGNWISQNGDMLKAGLGLLTGGMGAWNGMQQNRLVKQQMGQQANQFNEQMNISKQNLNRNLEDRQRARVASNPQAYESVSDYMKKYGVK